MSPSTTVDMDAALRQLHVAVVIPAFQAAETIADVLRTVPGWVRTVVVVVDGATDATVTVVRDEARRSPRVRLEIHTENRGVGAAMRTGYRRALEEGAEIVAKMDADGQMDPAHLPYLVLPVAFGQADYAKGNRFLRPETLCRMPIARLLGNAALSLLSKASSGYWNVLDPTNGYTVISREALAALDLERLDSGYFFESSVLVELGLVRAVVLDVPTQSRYGGEQSHLSVVRSVFSFALKHGRYGLRRVLYRYLLLDFSPASLLLLLSLPLVAFGVTFGMRSWLLSVVYGTPATAGTVMLAAFTTAGGLLCLVQAMIYDIMLMPQRPLTPPRLRALAQVSGSDRQHP